LLKRIPAYLIETRLNVLKAIKQIQVPLL